MWVDRRAKNTLLCTYRDPELAQIAWNRPLRRFAVAREPYALPASYSVWDESVGCGVSSDTESWVVVPTLPNPSNHFRAISLSSAHFPPT